MKKLRNQHILARARDFLTSWRLFAPANRFSNTSPDELEAAIRESEAIRREILTVEVRLSGLRLQRDQSERLLADRLIRLASGVRGNPDFGCDCPFYKSIGFVPASENRSGRPREQKE